MNIKVMYFPRWLCLVLSRGWERGGTLCGVSLQMNFFGSTFVVLNALLSFMTMSAYLYIGKGNLITPIYYILCC